MANICVACGAEICDECGSMICKQCYDGLQRRDVKSSFVCPNEKDAIVISFDPDNTTVDYVKRVLDNFKVVFPNNPIMAIPDSIIIKTMTEQQLQDFMNSDAGIILHSK